MTTDVHLYVGDQCVHSQTDFTWEQPPKVGMYMYMGDKKYTITSLVKFDGVLHISLEPHTPSVA